MDSTDKALKDLEEELMKDPVTREKMDNLEIAEQLITDSFPECEKIKKSDIKDIVSELFVFAESYHEISTTIYEHCRKLWPVPKLCYIPDSPSQRTFDYDEWYKYFYGDGNDNGPLGDWVQKFEESFIQQRGMKRTFEEACGVAADWWKIMIFEEVKQDNGDKSVGGLFGRGMAETLKRRSLAELNVTEISMKFRQIMYEYYMNGCQYKFSESYTGEMVPSVDYGPNGCLIDSLVKAGVPKEETGSICPWKTTISVDKRDNSVIIMGYQKQSII